MSNFQEKFLETLTDQHDNYWKNKVYTFTGLEHWTDIFLNFTDFVIGLINSHWLENPQGACTTPLNGE